MDVREEAINRLLRIIEQISRKLKIAICLPYFVSHEKWKNIVEDNLKELDSLYTVSSSENWKLEYLIIEEWSSKVAKREQSQVAQFDSTYLKIKLQLARILSHLSKYADKIIPIINDNLDKIPSNVNTIIEHIEYFKQIVEWKMRMTPTQLRAYKAELRNAKALVTTTQGVIQKLESDFNDETLKFNDMVKESQDALIKLKLVIEEIKNKRNEELDREMNSYKTRLRRLRDDIVEKENNLNNQLEAHEAVLEKLMQVNVEQEDILREYCKEAERKCLVVRDVYDRDLSKLNELKETLEMQLYATSNHCNSLKNECDEQNTLFMKLKKEREFAMMQAFAQRMANFEKNRAARIIQRTWRAYYERKLSRKKKRSRKKR